MNVRKICGEMMWKIHGVLSQFTLFCCSISFPRRQNLRRKEVRMTTKERKGVEFEENLCYLLNAFFGNAFFGANAGLIDLINEGKSTLGVSGTGSPNALIAILFESQRNMLQKSTASSFFMVYKKYRISDGSMLSNAHKNRQQGCTKFQKRYFARMSIVSLAPRWSFQLSPYTWTKEFQMCFFFYIAVIAFFWYWEALPNQ